ncbi:hypothetical protein FOA43_003054 [Brettanomyces nanus]|uniref:Uncharacterized protein n=1 Tax=Eeniella nana TaxID=13502 RepID=A0A875S5S2_EENNA|nr:uncharacterized protein FOA43_003054 [Brettanomyces nanus]QPG75695.1 hypothetical protein FOA43_003054 [Brettanomyces nanus]
MRYLPYLRQAQEILIKAGKGDATGLTGLYRHPNPRPVLTKLYNATLKKLAKDFPKESIYRQSVESMTKARLAVVEKNEVLDRIEKEIGCGLIEELVIQANDEYNLAQKMAEWKAWEPLQEKPLEDQWVYFGKKV